MSLEKQLREKEQQQAKGELLDRAMVEGLPLQDKNPTEYEKSARFIVEKNQDPQTLQDQMFQSNIPRPILPNVMMLHAIASELHSLSESDVTMIDEKKGKVVLFNNTDDQDHPLVKYRSISFKGYRELRHSALFWDNMLGGLMIQLPAIDGGVRKDGVTMVGSITNSDRALLEAQNSQGVGLVRRAYNILFGKGVKH